MSQIAYRALQVSKDKGVIEPNKKPENKTEPII